ncbi:two-component system, OmpR family, KDP operon response regulator KdpE [Desulfotomaculum arcticum]|uniref:Stage 0 sporulation protein A homolog n=1 Tax=Desulfotruncus arcticus DSM 17038 TaxID=1121424 RepID=A0A1I2U5F6_9FIRM|nr:response regulator transcription factor [Desulfotruncus arcticus]SFG72308.1 two-component system, OmpR family, KDP operon response regulator KdpE [Desulfotomaculum arcticum] [Desulfotruncus arcticus DSM 17038]
MKKARILVVDDEPRLVRLVKVNLIASGYEVNEAYNGKMALDLLEAANYDLIILDIMLAGDMDGYQVCSRIRQFSTIPIIMLTSKAREHDRVRGFDVGADDYLTKPFSVQELIRRVKAVLRRSSPIATTVTCPRFICNDLVINFAQRRVFVKGIEVGLTATEYQVLYHLAQHAGKIIPHEDLLTWVWGPEYRNEVQYLRGYISNLRKKIEDDPSNARYIISKHGIGYYLSNDND